MYEIPIPTNKNSPWHTQYHVLNDSVCLFFGNHTFFRDFTIRPLFRCLSIENVLTLFAAVVQEKQMFLLSENKSLLGQVCLAINSLLWPLDWCHTFFPNVLPCIQQLMNNPFPFIFGWNGSSLPNCVTDEDIIVVNLDQNSI